MCGDVPRKGIMRKLYEHKGVKDEMKSDQRKEAAALLASVQRKRRNDKRQEE